MNYQKDLSIVMNILIVVIVIVFCIYLCWTKESYSWSRFARIPIQKTRSSRLVKTPSWRTSSQSGNSRLARIPSFLRTQSWRTPSSGQTYPAPQQGLSWGHAYNPSTGTWAGIVPGSSISGLQQTYQHMFAPRSSQQMSGQQQRATHLAPGGLGHTGWVYRK